MLTVIHHTDWDGIASAYAVKQAVRHGLIPSETQENMRFVPANYGDDAPLDEDIVGRHVVIVDFCYPVDVLKEIKEKAASVIVIDHHATTPASANEAGVELVFDDQRSGAALVWDFYFASWKDRPTLVEYVQDHDLWRFKLPQSRTARAYLQSIPPNSIREAEIQADIFQTNFDRVINEGAIINRFNAKVIDEALKTRHVVNIGGHMVCAFNAHVLGPETADMAARLLESSPFFAVWKRVGDKYVVSIYKGEGRGEGLDLSEIAKAYGGGGHKNAAGFVCDILPWNAPAALAPPSVTGKKTKSRNG